MFPMAHTQVPGGVLLLVGGLLACFAGYRLFRLVLGVYGFILGAWAATSLVSPGTSTTLLIAAIAGGIVGAVLLTLAYYVGVAVIGAGLGAMVAYTLWPQIGNGAPTWLVLAGFGLAGAVLAIVFQRYVIIVGTAFGGAWTALAGVAALVGRNAVLQPADIVGKWTAHPFSFRFDGLSSPGGFGWVWIAWKPTLATFFEDANRSAAYLYF